MGKYNYDMTIIGAGSGGISAATLARNLGKRVALIEKRTIGGDCTWYGCIPSKALIQAANAARGIQRLADYGLRSSCPDALSTGKVMEFVRSVRHEIYQGHKPEVFQKKGVTVYFGAPHFTDQHTIRLNGEAFTSQSFIISTGSRPSIPPLEGLSEVPYLTNETLFELDALPGSMIVLGGGPIGSEMASAMNYLGVHVTIVEMGDRILPHDDQELVQILMEMLRDRGIRLLTGTKALRCDRIGNEIAVSVQNRSGEEETLKAEALLVAVGRTLNVDGLGLEHAGVRYSSQGISTDKTLQTTAKSIYACGDVVGPYRFSHVAEYQAEIAVPNALIPLPFKRNIDYTNIVWSTFTDPELAHGGLTEEEARRRLGDRINIYRSYYRNTDRARTDRADIGVAKFICDQSDALLGIHILGTRASELLHEAQLVKTLGVPFYRIKNMIHIYPSYGDLVKRPATAAYVNRLQKSFALGLLKKIFI